MGHCCGGLSGLLSRSLGKRRKRAKCRKMENAGNFLAVGNLTCCGLRLAFDCQWHFSHDVLLSFIVFPIAGATAAAAARVAPSSPPPSTTFATAASIAGNQSNPLLLPLSTTVSSMDWEEGLDEELLLRLFVFCANVTLE